jgi:hypothetical protein
VTGREHDPHPAADGGRTSCARQADRFVDLAELQPYIARE